MSSAQAIINEALQSLGVSSQFQEVDGTSLTATRRRLNGMISRWRDEGIDMGCVPIGDIGEELSEPEGARNGIIANLAIAAAPLFPTATVTEELRREARVGLAHIKRMWQQVEIPQATARSTYPKGAGANRNFFQQGEPVGDA